MPSYKSATIISTGSREIDDKMGGGVPLGSMTLVEGDSHSGKSVLTQQMSWGSLQDGFKLSFFTTENTVKSLVKRYQLTIDRMAHGAGRTEKSAPLPISREGGAGLSTVALASGQLESGRTTGMVITTERVVVSPWRTWPCVKPTGFWLK